MHEIVQTMLERIARFFHTMLDNEEKRLYYVFPIMKSLPYAYQHSSIRDLATICDILDLMEIILLPDKTLQLFQKGAGNTVRAYHADGFQKLPEGNIADLGFFLLAMQKTEMLFPSELPTGWQEAKRQLIHEIVSRQNEDGSIRLYFDPKLQSYEKESEPFYLPEALIALLQVSDEKKVVLRACHYMFQEPIRKRHLSSEIATFYINWQLQLLYHLAQKKLFDEVSATHLEVLVKALKELPISFDATVEVACYLEALVHAKEMSSERFDKEIARSLQFLYEVQTVNGGFVHSRRSSEARIDVAGHVANALLFLK